MPISRELALIIVKYLLDNPSFKFPFLVMCKGYTPYDDSDEDFVEIVPKDDYENLVDDTSYDTFELWENLHNLDITTLELMAKGFIDKILQNDILDEIENCAKGYRDLWKRELCESAKIEDYGLNEFFGGKAEGFEEALKILKKISFNNHCL